MLYPKKPLFQSKKPHSQAGLINSHVFSCGSFRKSNKCLINSHVRFLWKPDQKTRKVAQAMLTRLLVRCGKYPVRVS